MARIPGRRRSRPLTGCFVMTLHSYCAPIWSLSHSNRHFGRRRWRPTGGELWITCGHDRAAGNLPRTWLHEKSDHRTRWLGRSLFGLHLTCGHRSGDQTTPQRRAASRRSARRRLRASRPPSWRHRRRNGAASGASLPWPARDTSFSSGPGARSASTSVAARPSKREPGALPSRRGHGRCAPLATSTSLMKAEPTPAFMPLRGIRR